MASTPMAKPDAPALPGHYQALVLLVDDQAMIGEAVRRVLVTEPNIKFRYCGNPQEALALARELMPSVILQDLVMPGVDGLDLVRQYRADPVTHEIPIVVLSTKEEPAVKAQAFAVGASDYMVKLPDKMELVARVQYHAKSCLNQIQRKQKSLEQSALASFSVAALASEDFVGTLRLAVATARDVIRAQGGAVLQIDSVQDRISIVADIENVDAKIPNKLSSISANSLIPYLVKTKKAVRIADIGRESRFTLEYFQTSGFKSALLVPIPIAGGETAILGLACVAERAFTDDEEEFLQSFANILAVFHAREKTLERLRLRDRALEAITQGVTIKDSVPDGQIIYTNPAFCAITGYALDEVIGRGPSAFLDAGSADPLVAAELEKDTIRRDVRGKRKDNTTFIDHVALSPIIDPDGAVRYHVTVHEDVTESRKRDELVMDAKRMESVGQLTGGIAHDFNNLLAAIRSSAEDLKDTLTDEFDREMTEIILAAAGRGAGLVRQLMSFARKRELTLESVNVPSLIDDFLPTLRGLVPDTVVITVESGKNLPTVEADVERLRESIQNVVMNSCDAMPGGGAITIATKMTALDADYAAENLEVNPGRYLMIAVTDTGTGMPKDIAQRAFVPFFTTKEVGKGTGLGLSMVHGYVKQSGGHAKLYSEPGHGTTVKIYLPVPDIAASASAESVAARGAAGLKIILVEDDDLLRQTANNKLVKLDNVVMAVASAEAAVTLLESAQHFDLVLTDLVMAGAMSGADLIRVVRQRWPQVGVLATSGYPETVAAEKFGLPPDVRLLSKPYTAAELSQALANVCPGRG